MPAMGKLQRADMVQTPIVEPPIGEYGIQHGTWQQKTYTITDTKHIKIWNGGKLNSERETYLWRTHGITGTSKKKHLRQRLLLQHSSKVNNTSRLPWCQQWWQNHIILTWCCRKPHQGGGHDNHWEERLCTKAHTSHQRSSSCRCGSRSLRHNENTTKKGTTEWSTADIQRYPVQ